MADFVDRFGKQAGSYAAARPTYPDALFAFLADNSPSRHCAWDCATGNGQAALALAEYFKHVTATDASAAQLGEAASHPHITYRVATAADSGMGANSVDLITVAQALHWFDRQAFFAEADRFLSSGGLLAVWTYGLHSISRDVDQVVRKLHDDVLGDYWSPHRTLVESGYASLSFPFEPVPTPSFTMEARWTFDRLIGYLYTWSAREAYMLEQGEDPVPHGALKEAWGDAEELIARWPLAVFVLRKP